MFFALNEADLWGIVRDAYPKPSREDRAEDAAPLTAEESRTLREKESDWVSRNSKAIGKIGIMCSEIVQMNLDRSLNSHQIYEALKKEYQAKGWNKKWALASRIESTYLSNCKNATDFITRMCEFEEEVQEIGITIEYLTIKTLNSLSTQYEPFVTLLAQKAREENKLPSLRDIAWLSNTVDSRKPVK